jgi:hypothetical protein
LAPDVPRWDVTGNDPYGTGTAFDAIGDIKQLQHETRRKAQAIDKMVDPPMRRYSAEEQSSRPDSRGA